MDLEVPGGGSGVRDAMCTLEELLVQMKGHENFIERQQWWLGTRFGSEYMPVSLESSRHKRVLTCHT